MPNGKMIVAKNAIYLSVAVHVMLSLPGELNFAVYTILCSCITYTTNHDISSNTNFRKI